MFIRWRDKLVGIAWYFRKLDPAGQFFGDVTDTNRLIQRNFRGVLGQDVLPLIVMHYEDLKNGKGAPSTEGEAHFVATVGVDLKHIEFQGSWQKANEMPSEVRELVHLINHAILPCLLLSSTDDQTSWANVLK